MEQIRREVFRLLGSPQAEHFASDLLHAGSKSFLSPNYHVFPSAQFMVNRRSEESTRVGIARSEEHTSELQSRLHLVCRLLLEKKKKHYLCNINICIYTSDV